MLKIGNQAPDFTLKSDTGADVSLGDFKGKRGSVVLLPQSQHARLNDGSVRVS